MTGENCSQVNRPGTLRSIESPDCFGPVRIHIHGFRTIAPAGSDSHTEPNTTLLEFFLTGSGFPHPTNGGIRNDTLDWRSVRLTQTIGIKTGQTVGHVHGLLLKRFTHTTQTTINGRADSDLWIRKLFVHKRAHSTRLEAFKQAYFFFSCHI